MLFQLLPLAVRILALTDAAVKLESRTPTLRKMGHPMDYKGSRLNRLKMSSVVSHLECQRSTHVGTLLLLCARLAFAGRD